jgi:hypothetical protein
MEQGHLVDLERTRRFHRNVRTPCLMAAARSTTPAVMEPTTHSHVAPPQWSSPVSVDRGGLGDRLGHC